MNKEFAQRFLLAVRDWRGNGGDRFPVWDDPDILFVFATDIKSGREVVVVGAEENSLCVRTRQFNPYSDPPVFYHGWWAALESLRDFNIVYRSGLVEHESIVAPFLQAVTSS